MSVVEEVQPAPVEPASTPHRLRRAAVVLAVLAGIFAGLAYTYKLNGLELNTPNGVNVIVLREDFDGFPPASVRPTLSRLEKLSQHNTDDFGFVGFDGDAKRIVVNLATEDGRNLLDAAMVGDMTPLVVRTGRHSISELRQIMADMFVEIDEFWGATMDRVNNRIIASSTSMSPGLLGKIKELYGTDMIAVWWQPFEEGPRAT